MPRRALITGSAGFIGFHLASNLLRQGWEVHGMDGFSDYYDVQLKKERHLILSQNPSFSEYVGLLEDDLITTLVKRVEPEIVFHLAAQAGVRYSIDNPKSYINILDQMKS